MLNSVIDLRIQVDPAANRMIIHYRPRTERTLYDLCDLNGRVLRTGVISSHETTLETEGLKAQKYVMLVVDGDQVLSQRISMAA